jgi:intracellular sulfur oxidation DsrE/DsrF family protein
MRAALAALVLFTALAPAPALAAKAPPTTAAPAPQAAPGLVFVLRTGLEDAVTLSSALRHAKVAKESGAVAEVTVVVYGRAIVIFDKDVKMPEDIGANLVAARAAGVRVVACKTALDKYGIPEAVAAEKAEVVAQGIVEIARLAALGHALLPY